MHDTNRRLWSRRQALCAGLVAPLGLALAACLGGDDDEPAATSTPAVPPEETSSPTSTATPEATGTATPAATGTGTPTPQATTRPEAVCTGVLTPAQTEGPFYTPDTPERSDLLGDGSEFERLRVDGGVTLVLGGGVYTQDCEPIPGAWLDFWHTDVDGEYDNAGYELRGHQFADDEGRYQLRTVMPAEYPGRPRHIHVKVQPLGGQVLTTQIYFPGDELDFPTADEAAALVMELADRPRDDGTIDGVFNFVLDTA